MVTIAGDVVRVSFRDHARAHDAVAIFLPTYSNVSRIHDRATTAP